MVLPSNSDDPENIHIPLWVAIAQKVQQLLGEVNTPISRGVVVHISRPAMMRAWLVVSRGSTCPNEIGTIISLTIHPTTIGPARNTEQRGKNNNGIVKAFLT